MLSVSSLAEADTATDGIIGGTGAHRSASWAEFLDLTLGALPYEYSSRVSGGTTYYQLPDAICCAGDRVDQLHLFLGPTGGLGAVCHSNGPKASGVGETPCSYWRIIHALEWLTGVLAPSQPKTRQVNDSDDTGVTAEPLSGSRRPSSQGVIVQHCESGLRHPARAALWALLVAPQPGASFTGAELQAAIDEAVKQACRRAGIGRYGWTLKQCRAAAASSADHGIAGIHLPVSVKRGSRRAYFDAALADVDDALVQSLADLFTDLKDAGCLRHVGDPSEVGQGVNPRATERNPRAIRTDLRSAEANPRALETNPRSLGSNPLAQLGPLPVQTPESNSKTPNSLNLGKKEPLPPASSPFIKVGVVRGWEASSNAGSGWLRESRILSRPPLVEDVCRPTGTQLHPGPLDAGIAIALSESAPTVDGEQPVWSYVVAGRQRWDVTVQLPVGAEPPLPGQEVQVLTRNGERHQRTLGTMVRRQPYGRLGIRYWYRVEPDQRVEERAEQRLQVHRWGRLAARASGSRVDWQPRREITYHHWRTTRPASLAQRDRARFAPIAEGCPAPHSIITPPAPGSVREARFTDLLEAPRWMLMRSTTPKAPVPVGDGAGGWLQPSSRTPNLWANAPTLALRSAPANVVPAYNFGESDETALPPVVVLDIDYRPERDVDGLGRGVRDAWVSALWAYPQSESVGGEGRHVLATVHPDDAAEWGLLQAAKIHGSDDGGSVIDLFPPGTVGYVGLTRQWVRVDGALIEDPEWVERREIPVLRVRQLFELPGGSGLRRWLAGSETAA